MCFSAWGLPGPTNKVIIANLAPSTPRNQVFQRFDLTTIYDSILNRAIAAANFPPPAAPAIAPAILTNTTSIAFPLIGTGKLRYGPVIAADQGIRAILAWCAAQGAGNTITHVHLMIKRGNRPVSITPPLFP